MLVLYASEVQKVSGVQASKSPRAQGPCWGPCSFPRSLTEHTASIPGAQPCQYLYSTLGFRFLLCRGLCCLLLTSACVYELSPSSISTCYFYLKKKKRYFFFRADLGFQKIGRYKVPHIFWDQDLSHHSSEFVAIGKPILTHLYPPHLFILLLLTNT